MIIGCLTNLHTIKDINIQDITLHNHKGVTSALENLCTFLLKLLFRLARNESNGEVDILAELISILFN